MSDKPKSVLPGPNEKQSLKFILDSLRSQLLEPKEPGIERLEAAAPPKVESFEDLRARIPDGKKYFRIAEVSEIVGVRTQLLRFWETEFPSIRPEKTRTNQRVYREKDVLALLKIHHLIHIEKFSLDGARVRFKEWRKQFVEGEITLPKPIVQPEQAAWVKELKSELAHLITTVRRGPQH